MIVNVPICIEVERYEIIRKSKTQMFFKNI